MTLPGYVGRTTDEELWEGAYSPTFLTISARSVREHGAEIAVNGQRRIEFVTDAGNDYFTRPDNRGRIFTHGLGGKFSYAYALRNGRLTVTFTALPDHVAVGDQIAFSLSLLDDAMPEPVTADLKLRVVETRTTTRPGTDRERIDQESDGEDEIREGRALPPSKWLTRDGRTIGEEETSHWPDDFTDQDGGKVEDFGEVSVYCINYDNAHFRRFLDRERSDLDKKVVAEQYRIGMLVLMMGLEDAYSRMAQGDSKMAIEEHIDEIRRLAAQGAATVVMSIAKTLPTIVNPASVADPDDD